jgi:hypothetical protein
VLTLGHPQQSCLSSSYLPAFLSGSIALGRPDRVPADRCGPPVRSSRSLPEPSSHVFKDTVRHSGVLDSKRLLIRLAQVMSIIRQSGLPRTLFEQ